MYNVWTVAKLKQELRSRNAITSGKKAALIERLEAYDKNNLIGVLDELEDETPTIPAIENFRDVNAGTKLPALTKTHLQEFSDRFGVPTKKGRALYENRCLLSLRVAYGDQHTYFHAQCKAQMKKIMYIVILKIDGNNMIQESHCECAAGSGLEAHCKHIFAVLHGIEDMVQTKTIIMHQSCTQRLMMFKKPKTMFYDSPMQSHNLPTKHKQPTNSVLYSPLNDEDVMDNYEDYVRNLAVGQSTTGSKMAYLQLIEPANPYAIEHDHDYTKKTAEDVLLENLLLKEITQAQVEDKEEKTKLQDASKDWHQTRSVRITASNFHAVCHSKGATCRTLANNILNPRKFTSRATTHGKINEPVAIEEYEGILSDKIRRCGIFISQTHPFLAASPDGMLQNETVVEVKCPFLSRQLKITPDTVPYLYECNGELKLKNKHMYYTQIQGQLFCTNKKICNLVVYTFKDMEVIRVQRDEQFICDMVGKLTSFYEQYLKPGILNKYLYKSYGSLWCDK